MSKIRKPRTNYDILGYKISCFHECAEYKYGVCSHCRSRDKCVNHVRPVYPSEEGIYFPTEKVEISFKHVESLDFYIHELTEVAIIQILRGWRKDWNAKVQFEGYKKTYITHFITLCGANNGCSLFPVTRKNKPKW